MFQRNIHFESALERIGRILARQYNIEVVFEGSVPCTDGKKIILPSLQNIDADLYKDLNGFLDHEVAHCLFTEFEQMKTVKKRYHKELFNACEDSRIEIEMIKEYPGCELNLTPLNEKYRGKMMEKLPTMPWPVRTIIAVRDIMDGRTPTIDPEIKDYMELVKDDAVALRRCTSSKEIRDLTEVIMNKIIQEMEENGEGEEEKKEAKGAKGKGKPAKDGKPSKSGDPSDMMGEGVDEEGSEFDKHKTDIDSQMSEALAEHAKKEDKESKPKRGSNPYHEGWSTKVHIPFSTQFDKELNYVGKGDSAQYAKLKKEVMHMIQPIKAELERVLKVQENARWRMERERGSIDVRQLAKLGANKSYRTVFKEFSKNETNNVAVGMLIDQSGSMAGEKIRMAKMAAIAIGEALKDLQIPFEVTGFYTETDRKMQDAAIAAGDTSRFNRVYEALRLCVFKDFDSSSLVGITKIHNGSQNCDGESVSWAAKRLALLRNEKRKILIVLSDGLPASDGDRSVLNTDLKKKVEAIRKSGIECIGIGIQSDAVKRFYPDYIVLSELKDLPKAVLRKLAGTLVKGVR